MMLHTIVLATIISIDKEVRTLENAGTSSTPQAIMLPLGRILSTPNF